MPVGRAGRATVDGRVVRARLPRRPARRRDAARPPGTGRLYVASKERLRRRRCTPRREPLAADGRNRLRRLGDVLPIATDGAFFPDGEHLVLRNYGAAPSSTPSRGSRRSASSTLPEQQQGEGIAVDADGGVYVSSRAQVTGAAGRAARGRTPRVDAAPSPRRRPTADRAREPSPPPSRADGAAADADAERPAWPWFLAGWPWLALVVRRRCVRSLRRR